jgi:hypothetical protein
MTYGWAIALVVIIAVVLFAMGVFDTSNFIGNKTAGFSEIGVNDFRLDTEGNLTLMMMNQVGRRIVVNNVSATIGQITGFNDTTYSIPAGNTQNVIISGFGDGSVGDSMTGAVVITYSDVDTGIRHTTTGNVIGKVS